MRGVPREAALPSAAQGKYCPKICLLPACRWLGTASCPSGMAKGHPRSPLKLLMSHPCARPVLQAVLGWASCPASSLGVGPEGSPCMRTRWAGGGACPHSCPLLQVEKELAFASQKLFGKPTPVPDVEDCGKHLGRSLWWLGVWVLWRPLHQCLQVLGDVPCAPPPRSHGTAVWE